MIIRMSMKKIIFPVFLIFLGIIVTTYFFQSEENSAKGQNMTGKKRIFLMGASVGKEWNLPDLPKRMNNEHFIVESQAVYQFDKSDALDEVLMRPKRKFHFTRTYFRSLLMPAPQLPDILIIKECAAYFPGDMALYQKLIKRWVEQVRSSKIEVVLATVVSVTKERAEKDKGKIESIRDYNNWVKEYAKKENIRILDLEIALRTDDKERFLRDEYTSGDGLHLNKKAYDVLDRLFQDTFELKTAREE